MARCVLFLCALLAATASAQSPARTPAPFEVVSIKRSPPEARMTRPGSPDPGGRWQSLNATLMCCGHGPVVKQPNTKLQELIDHRHEREAQILRLASEGKDTVSAIVKAIYPELDMRLYGMATSQVRSHLSKLEREGRVGMKGSGGETKVEVL